MLGSFTHIAPCVYCWRPKRSTLPVHYIKRSPLPVHYNSRSDDSSNFLQGVLVGVADSPSVFTVKCEVAQVGGLRCSLGGLVLMLINPMGMHLPV